MRNQLLAIATVTTAIALAACTTRTTPPPQPPRPAPAPGPAELSPIHQNLDPLDTVWHVRAGLNVAALSCAQQQGPSVVTDYNEFLKAKKALLAESYEALSAKYRARGGNWQRALDTDMTKLYNHFASPTAQPGFCAAAKQEVKHAIAANPDAAQAWAKETLAKLDRPFTAPQQLAARAAPMGLLSAAPPATTIPAGWRIQLGAFGSKSAAESAWSNIKARSDRIGGMSPHFEPVPGKPLTRLQVKGVENQADAIGLCAHAAAAGFDCFPVKPG